MIANILAASLHLPDETIRLTRSQRLDSTALSCNSTMHRPHRASTADFRRHAPRASHRSAIPTHGYDYYELLGVSPGASPEVIKAAYRRLQKRCHPDVAGREDMAILLNEAYSTLSDPVLRFTYDQLRSTWMADDAYTGRPLYSSWHGPVEEEAAVFVDEVSCIGCLNCAVIASRTFAVECKHGRARAVRQWADDEATINAAVLSCPVNCIWWVERSKLAALEHMMNSLPRPALHSIQVGSDKGRTVDVFHLTERFLEKRKRKEGQAETTRERRRMAEVAFEAIRGWWGHPGSPAEGDGRYALVPYAREPFWAGQEWRADGIPEELRSLHDAATGSGCKQEERSSFFTMKVGEEEEEYWDPTRRIFKHDGPTDNKHARASVPYVDTSSEVYSQYISPDSWPQDPNAGPYSAAKGSHAAAFGLIPLVFALGAGTWSWVGAGEDAYAAAGAMAVQGVYSPVLPPELVNSAALRVVLCMAVWYTVGSAVMHAAQAAMAVLSKPRDV